MKFESFNMYWYDLKLWQIFKMKHKIYAVSKICISPNLIVKKQNIWHIGGAINTIYKSFKTFHLKIPL
jgi:hypothetical protein